MTWLAGPLLGFDTETTGVNVFTDRIVTAALVSSGAEGEEVRTWLIDPGVEIPAGASAVHGITTAHARAHGRPPREALEEMSQQLYRALAAGVPVVGFNINFDLTLLEAELARHGLPTLAAQLGGPIAPVVDPLVLDRGLDRYRRGKRTLEHLCTHYGVTTGDLHDAGEDVQATLGVLRALGAKFPEISGISPAELHTWQVGKHREWAENFNEWRRSKGLEGPGATAEWPVQAAPA